VRNPKAMDIMVHRAGSTFYPLSVTLLNQPGRELSAFLEIPEWSEIAAASYLELPEVSDTNLLDFTRYTATKVPDSTMFELTMQSGTVKHLFNRTHPDMEPSRRIAESIGLNRVSLIADFPITTAVYGFSRVDYQAGKCFINPFPPDRDHGNKFPIFVDLIQAD